MQDHYEILQVHPRADADAIAAAYRRLRALYDPSKLDGAADELLELARAKRDAIEYAYAVLGDPLRRAAYDAEKNQEPRTKVPEPASGSRFAALGSRTVAGSQEQLLDYRPLPPAKRAERPRGFAEQTVSSAAAPGRAASPARARRLTLPFVFGGLFALIIAASLLLTGGGAAPAPAPAPTPAPFDTFEAAIPQARSAAEQNPNSAQAWSDLGNLLYDSAQIVRESAPDSPLYQQRLPRWLEATQAYSQALALEPNNAVTRADMGASACFYGAGKADQNFVRSGTAEVQRAVQAAPNDERVLLSLGHCLVSMEPPQTDQAITIWRQIIEKNPSSQFAAQVNQLIAKYQK